MAEAEQQEDVGGPGADALDRDQRPMRVRASAPPARRDRARRATPRRPPQRPDFRQREPAAPSAPSSAASSVAATAAQRRLQPAEDRVGAGHRHLLRDDDRREPRESPARADAAAAGRRSRPAADGLAVEREQPRGASASAASESISAPDDSVGGSGPQRERAALGLRPRRGACLRRRACRRRAFWTSPPCSIRARALDPRHDAARPTLRFAPTPNGLLHLGHAYSALRNADSPARLGGRLLLRLRTRTPTRCRPEYETALPR